MHIYGNFIGKKSYQIAYCSFYGKGREINLSYIILRDENSNTYVVEVSKCKLSVIELDDYDLKCRINLSEAPSGKYIVSEYYIANKQNYRNIKIIIE